MSADGDCPVVALEVVDRRGNRHRVDQADDVTPYEFAVRHMIECWDVDDVDYGLIAVPERWGWDDIRRQINRWSSGSCTLIEDYEPGAKLWAEPAAPSEESDDAWGREVPAEPSVPVPPTDRSETVAELRKVLAHAEQAKNRHEVIGWLTGRIGYLEALDARDNRCAVETVTDVESAVRALEQAAAGRMIVYDETSATGARAYARWGQSPYDVAVVWQAAGTFDGKERHDWDRIAVDTETGWGDIEDHLMAQSNRRAAVFALFDGDTSDLWVTLNPDLWVDLTEEDQS